MRAMILLLLVSLALAAAPALENAPKLWASDSAEERDAASRAVAEHLARELQPLLAAMKSPDPEVRRRARAALEALLPPKPPEPPVPELPQQAVARIIINNQGAQQMRFALNAQGQMVLMQDQGEMQQLQAKGITGTPVEDPVMREQLSLAEGRGFAVIAVAPRSEAARLGIESLDILVSIDGRPVKQAAEVLKGLGARSPEIKIMRRGKMVTLGVKEGEGASGAGK
jgi:C-terminal processing protease CtpA/Prc